MRKLVLVLLVSATAAQNSTNSWDTGVWFAGGHSVPGGTSDVSVFDAGVRLGKVLTADHGSGALRGNFEYAIDLVPLYLVHQPTVNPVCTGVVGGGSCTRLHENVYGGGFNPINLKWNFTSAKRVTPYLELGGGTLFSTEDVPAFTNKVNFRTHASLGAHLWSRNTAGRGITVEARYEHISNAGLASPNPGINSIQFMIGWNTFSACTWFHHCHLI